MYNLETIKKMLMLVSSGMFGDINKKMQLLTAQRNENDLNEKDKEERTT